ncbi:MAG: CDP-glycerol glycerophosphotransferase family protein [Treponema sp.]|nr:CDP-glycerol glycerophosphotransferase family protein [Treponema sp.]
MRKKYPPPPPSPEKRKKLFTVLVSPSWGTSALLSRYGERLLDPLIKTGWRIIVRPHPQSKQSEKPLLAKLQQKYENVPTIEWNYDSENISVLAKSDIMISDFSGIIFDYIALFNKPVLYANEKIDLRPYNTFFLNKEDYWPLRALKKFGLELKEKNFGFLRDIITRAVKDKTAEEARKWTKDNAWQRQGESGKIVTDYMIQVKGGFL